MSLIVGGLWHYPVKTLAGERLDTAEITINGIVGDRIVHVRGPEGVRTSRRHHNLLGLHATLGADGEPLLDGEPWTSPEILDRVRAAAGPDATLARYDGPERFDVLPLLVATTAQSPRSVATSAGSALTSSSTGSTAWTRSPGPAPSSMSAMPSSRSIRAAAAAP